MKNCKKCEGLAVTLGWSACPQITKTGSGEMLATAKVDRILNSDFYPPGEPADNLDEWPRCPECLHMLPSHDYFQKAGPVEEQGAALLWAFGLLVLLFLGLLITFLFY